MEMKYCLVIGAGSGIGFHLLQKLQEKANVFPIGISRRGEGFHYPAERGKNYRCDLLKKDEVYSVFENIASEFPRLDLLYVCSGNGVFGRFQDITDLQWDEHFALNVKGPFLALQSAFPLLLKAENPLVTVLSSTAGHLGFSESAVYCASKHAVAGLAKALREEWKKHRIRISTVYPGAVYTSIWENREGFEKKDMISPEDFGNYLASFSEIPRSAVPEEIHILPLKGIL
ncbi:MAG TPA: SDR family oxidoreductase [Leptospiraceae bacterium]|nr:SDR family oxidoreductase [Leptospiraceae bacterium]